MATGTVVTLVSSASSKPAKGVADLNADFWAEQVPASDYFSDGGLTLEPGVYILSTFKDPGSRLIVDIDYTAKTLHADKGGTLTPTNLDYHLSRDAKIADFFDVQQWLGEQNDVARAGILDLPEGVYSSDDFKHDSSRLIVIDAKKGGVSKAYLIYHGDTGRISAADVNSWDYKDAEFFAVDGETTVTIGVQSPVAA